MRFHPRDDHLSSILGTSRGVSDLETKIMPQEIREKILRSSHQAEASCQKHRFLASVLMLYKTGCGNKGVIGGSQ